MSGFSPVVWQNCPFRRALCGSGGMPALVFRVRVYRESKENDRVPCPIPGSVPQVWVSLVS